jgi:hypothetical protein
MLGKIKKWLGLLPPPEPKRSRHERRKGDDRRKQPDRVEIDRETIARMKDRKLQKNALVRKKYVREDSGTHETLKIVDDSLVDSGEETGIDPYNTGNFDRSTNWDKRFRN